MSVDIPKACPPSQLKAAIQGFIAKHDLGQDVHWYTEKEWKERGEEYCLKSPFVVTFEGDLYRVINWGDGNAYDHQLHEALYKIVQDLGWYWEQGNAWNMGFYKRGQ